MAIAQLGRLRTWGHALRMAIITCLAMLVGQAALWIIVWVLGVIPILALVVPLAIVFTVISYPALWCLNLLSGGMITKQEEPPDVIFLVLANSLFWSCVAFLGALFRRTFQNNIQPD